MSSTFKNWTSDNYAFVGKAFDFAYADRLNKLSPVVGEVNAKSIDYDVIFCERKEWIGIEERSSA